MNEQPPQTLIQQAHDEEWARQDINRRAMEKFGRLEVSDGEFRELFNEQRAYLRSLLGESK